MQNKSIHFITWKYFCLNFENILQNKLTHLMKRNRQKNAISVNQF
jgi:hypothetical protein